MPLKSFHILLILWAFTSVHGLANLPFEIEADHIKLNNKEEQLHASGNVIINYKTYVITAEEAHYLKQKSHLELAKSVTIKDDKKNTLSADHIALNLNTNIGNITNGTIKTNKNYIITGEKINLNKDNIIIRNCSITTCNSTRPEWIITSKTTSLNKTNSLIHSKENTIFFFNIPIFHVPIFSQNTSNEKISNQPIPEFGYNQIDYAFGNIYIGYLIHNNITGKAGIGLSQNRGFRYGATQIFTPKKNQSFILKTYHINKTGFEGGVSYHWKKINESNDSSIITTLLMPSDNKKSTLTFDAEYTYDNILFNELYHAIPKLKLEMKDRPFIRHTELDASISSGYYQDRKHSGHRHNITIKAKKNIARFNQQSTLDNDILVKLNEYGQKNKQWHRLLNSTTFEFNILNTKNKSTYTKVLRSNGRSPFIFDTINEIEDDEISTQSDINFQPLILSIETNYQINLKSFRNFRYTAQWQFQCWQIGLGVDTIWKEINLGISIRNI